MNLLQNVVMLDSDEYKMMFSLLTFIFRGISIHFDLLFLHILMLFYSWYHFAEKGGKRCKIVQIESYLA